MTESESEQVLSVQSTEGEQTEIQETPKVKSNLSGSCSKEFTERLQYQTFITIPDVLQKDSDIQKKNEKAMVDTLVAINPQDEIEGMLAAQTVAIHNAAMECFSYAGAMGSAAYGQERKIEYLNQATKLCRAFAGSIEALTKYRHKDIIEQKLVVERVHVHDGGKAIVGNVKNSMEGATR